MKLTGSRATNTFDRFSDWDYQVDSAEDFPHIAARIAEAAAWNHVRRGSLCVVTVIDRAGVMYDYAGAYEAFAAQWDALGVPEEEIRSIFDYWIIAFKHLKGMYRDYDELVSVGIEMSTGIARDIYLARKYDLRNFKNFYTYKQFAPVIEADSQLKQITGLAYLTTSEKLTKLEKLNSLVLEVSRDVSAEAFRAFEMRAKELQASP